MASDSVPVFDPQKQRDFALEVVQRLGEAGFEAYWAGGCVRDQLLGRTPKDYDVATNAQPHEIRHVFGHRRTLPLGAAFGVITVLGPKGAGQIEVATFRRDVGYSDGRRPDQVAFSSAEEDAGRRDFTINGLFYDPQAGRVIDFVGGEEDLRRQVLRAIGDPVERFTEDKLRMLRAVRFAATLDFAMDDATREAIRRMADEILVVSAERIAMEMRRVLEDPRRALAVRMLIDTRLATVVLPEISAADPPRRRHLDRALAVLDRLREPLFPLALAALLDHLTDAEGTLAVGVRWRLSNKEIERTVWLVGHRDILHGARQKPWSAMQKILIAPGIHDLIALYEAVLDVEGEPDDDLRWCRERLAQPREELDPPPLLTGSDLLREGVVSGPIFRTILERVRDAQLDGQLHTQAEALALAHSILNQP